MENVQYANAVDVYSGDFFHTAEVEGRNVAICNSSCFVADRKLSVADSLSVSS